MLISVISGFCLHFFFHMAEKEEVSSINGTRTPVLRTTVVLSVGLSLTFPNIYGETHCSIPASTVGCSPYRPGTEGLLESGTAVTRNLSLKLLPFASSSLLSDYTQEQNIMSLVAHWLPLLTTNKIDHTMLFIYNGLTVVFWFISSCIPGVVLCAIIMYHLFPHKLSCKGTFISLVLSFAKTGLIPGLQSTAFQNFFWRSSIIKQLITAVSQDMHCQSSHSCWCKSTRGYRVTGRDD